jgi:hypothetical protein
MSKRKKSRDELRRLAEEVCQLIRQMEPNAVIKATLKRLYETEDAWIEVLLPYCEWNRKAERISDAVYKRVWEIEMEHGYHIGVSLRTLDEVKAGTR